MGEIWKPIKGFENEYLVSNLGRVKSLERYDRFNRHVKEKILVPRPNTNGYLRVQLRRKDYYIHRLVANAFIDNPNNYNEINHISGIKTDNKKSNLEWCNRQYNNQYNFKIGSRTREEMKRIANCDNHVLAMKKRRKLTDKQILEIRKMFDLGISNIKISKMFNCSRHLIDAIKNNKLYKDVF